MTGRRERKKAQTRDAIAEAARRLFVARGFDAVSVKEIADAADVAVTTLFKHFPSKEALAFDLDDDHEQALVAAVRERPVGASVVEALRDHLLGGSAVTGRDHPEFRAFVAMVERTPALRDYAIAMWRRHEVALAAAIAEAVGAEPGAIEPLALAHFALEVRVLVRDRPDPAAAMRRAFELLERGLGDYGRR